MYHILNAILIVLSGILGTTMAIFIVFQESILTLSEFGCVICVAVIVASIMEFKYNGGQHD